MTEKINQKEYLKKYFSNDDKKKKKKKQKIGLKTVKIIDDDVDLEKMRAIAEDEFDIVNTTEDAPQIVGIVDERGAPDFSDKSRWRIIADDGTGEISIREKTLNARDEDEDRDDQSSEKNSKENAKLLIKSKDITSKKKVKGSSEILSQSKSKSPLKVVNIKQEEVDSDSDLSIPRKSPSSNEDESHRKKTEKSEKRKKKNRKRDDDDDFSPPRSKKSKSSKRRNSSNSDTDSDVSSFRNKSKREHSSYKKRNRSNSSESDRITKKSLNSRKKKSLERNLKNNNKNYDSDLSPPRKSEGKSGNKNKNYDSDFSPSRKSGERKSRAENKNYDSDLSPPRKSARKDSDSDLSPPRNIIKKENDSDLSPPRRDKSKHGKTFDSRRNRKDNSDAPSLLRIRRRSREKSPRRLKTDEMRYEKPSSSDGRFERQCIENRRDFERYSSAKRNRKTSESPTRRSKKSRWNRESRSRSPEILKDKRMTKTLDGKTAGLQDAKALRDETDAHKRRETEMFEKLSAEVSGAGQSVVIRDRKTGRRRDLQAEAALEREKDERQQEINEQYAKWGRGLKQLDDREKKLQDDLHEMSKPLARYKDDEDLTRIQKNRLLDDDPMLQFGQEKLIEQNLLKKGSKNKFSGPPNRFGIPPGERWDGVDRSNGYEKKWFEAQNSKKARSQEAYKWSTADM